VQTFEPEKMSPDRGGARTAILNAARVVAAREGVENLTLSKVAAEADLPRPVVYGQFVRKEDLLLCVAADSVVRLARKMGGVEPAEVVVDDAENESAVILTLPRTEAESEVVAHDVAVASSGGRQLRSNDKHEEAAPVGDAEKSTPRAPDAWLERRLRVFERAMTQMETRQEQVEKTSRAMAVSAENSIKALEETLSTLIARIEESDTRQKTTANDIRKALSEANLRIETVASVAHVPTPESDAQPSALLETFVPTPVAEPEEVRVEPKPMTQDVASHSFLSAARASAIAAAAVTAQPDKTPKVVLRMDARLPYIIGAAIVIVVFIVAAGIAFSQGVRDGKNDALRNSVLLTAHQAPRVATAPVTELDRLTKQAEAGNASAELAIALRYLDSSASVHNPQAGMMWMARAAKQGNPVAQYGLGSLYQKGVGTKVDAIQAMHWYEASALQGNRKAMHDLAIAYAEGLGGVKSPSEAVRWFARAANLGYVDSQFNLAVLYERGDGVPQSLLDAFKWYAIAGAQGDAESKLRLDALRTQLSADNLAAAQRAANAFRPLPLDPAANVVPKI
jgi:AcrR family transcriptional regulator